LRYSDRQYILANAAKCLKDNQYEGSTLFISDDVTKEVREQRKKLKEKYLDDLRKRDEVEFAYVTWSLPAKILYKVKGEEDLKSDSKSYLRSIALLILSAEDWSRFWRSKERVLDPETVRSHLCFLFCSLLINYGQLFSP